VKLSINSKGISEFSLNISFHAKFSANLRIFSLGSSFRSSYACFDSAKAYLFLIKELPVAVANTIAAGYDDISTSSLFSFLLTRAYKIASSTLSSARLRIPSNSGLVKSSIFKSGIFIYFVAAFRKGYFAMSFFVNWAVFGCIYFFTFIPFLSLVLGKT